MKVVEFDPHSARFAPVKYLFIRKGLVRVSIGKLENEPLETRTENVIEVALPFVDDFSQDSELGETIELEVYRLFLPLVSVLTASIIVHLQTRKSGKTDVCPNVAARTCSRALGERTSLRPDRNCNSRRADGR